MINNNQIYRQDIDAGLKQEANYKRLGNKKIMITGATGMVGSCLIDTMMAYSAQSGIPIRVIALARNEDKIRERFAPYLSSDYFSYVCEDISERMPYLPVKPDIIIHAASNSHPMAYAEDPIGTIKTNVFGLDNLLRYATEAKTERLLFLSSVEVYGENNTVKERFTESDCGYIDCNTLRAGYPESKRLGEALCQAYRAKHGIDVVIARLSRLYGPTMQMDDSKVVCQFIKRAIQNKDIVLKSSGQAVYSYTYVVDAVVALITILTQGKNGEVYNVADSQSETSILQLAELVAKVAGTKVNYEMPNATESKGYSNVQKSLMKAEKLEQLGWRPQTSLGQGIEKTIMILKEINRK